VWKVSGKENFPTCGGGGGLYGIVWDWIGLDVGALASAGFECDMPLRWQYLTMFAADLSFEMADTLRLECHRTPAAMVSIYCLIFGRPH